MCIYPANLKYFIFLYNNFSPTDSVSSYLIKQCNVFLYSARKTMDLNTICCPRSVLHIFNIFRLTYWDNLDKTFKIVYRGYTMHQLKNFNMLSRNEIRLKLKLSIHTLHYT